MPAKISKTNKGAVWRNLKAIVKKVFSLGRQKRMKIGEPYNFHHKETWVGIPPATVRPPARATATGGGGGENSGAGDETLMSGASGGILTVGHAVEADAGIEAVTAAATADDLCVLVSDDMTITDDGDSSWEDAEPSRMFPVIRD